MSAADAESRYSIALTQASLGKLPPELQVATGHDDEVMLFLLRVGDATETMRALMAVITLSETNSILKTFSATRGLIQKRFHIDDANRLESQLDTAGTVVEFVRPDQAENFLSRLASQQ